MYNTLLNKIIFIFVYKIMYKYCSLKNKSIKKEIEFYLLRRSIFNNFKFGNYEM